MASIIIFASSLFISFVLLLLKAIEIRFQKRNFILRAIGRLDDKFLRIADVLKFRLFQLIQTIRYVLIVKSREILSNTFLQMEQRFAGEYKMRQESIMGRKNIVNRGSVSFYLKKISEEKQNTEKGKIVEENLIVE